MAAKAGDRVPSELNPPKVVIEGVIDEVNEMLDELEPPPTPPPPPPLLEDPVGNR